MQIAVGAAAGSDGDAERREQHEERGSSGATAEGVDGVRGSGVDGAGEQGGVDGDTRRHTRVPTAEVRALPAGAQQLFWACASLFDGCSPMWCVRASCVPSTARRFALVMHSQSGRPHRRDAHRPSLSRPAAPTPSSSHAVVPKRERLWCPLQIQSTPRHIYSWGCLTMNHSPLYVGGGLI